jgi:Abortive infection C-terminus
LTNFELTWPNCVDTAEWRAVSALDERLSRALRDHDAELMLGTPKELCEAVAKVTCQQRREPFTPLGDMPDLINQAHRLVDRLPAEGGAAGGAVRDIAQTAMKLAKQLNELRNQAGSGHGRPTPTGLDEVDGRFGASTALIWCPWMLGRLDALVASDPDRVAGDISRQVFSRGDLEQRLIEAGFRRWRPPTSLQSASL